MPIFSLNVFPKNNYCTPETHLATRKCICISMWFSKRFRIAVFLRENHVAFAQATYTFYNESYMICQKNHRKIPQPKYIPQVLSLPKLLGQFLPWSGRGVGFNFFPSDNQLKCPRTQMRERQLAPTVVNFNSTMDACAKGASPQSLEADSYWRTLPPPPDTENFHEEMQLPLKKGGVKRTCYFSKHWVSRGIC